MHDDGTVQLVVQTTRGSKEFSFDKNAKVADVIATAVREFGFSQGDHFQLVLASNPGEPLQPERTLVSYHLADGTIVILTAVGSGV
jgi:hypothetical protein